MVSVVTKPGTVEKLRILSADAQYDLACACGSRKNEHRTRGDDGKWIYPVAMANGSRGSLFRTLISNACVNDCKYCPLRASSNVRRCGLDPSETAETFADLINRDMVFGAFLTSGVCGSADASMDNMIQTAEIIRKKHRFRGYLHLKVIPGASDGAIEYALASASAVSINIETPGEQFFRKLSQSKDFNDDIIRPLKTIARLTAPGAKFENKKVTTQFIVGAADESDQHIIHYTAALYQRLNLHRVYFSAYQKGLGDAELEGEKSEASPEEVFTREHRLYQADFLLRKYGFKEDDFLFDTSSNFNLHDDPKQVWADNHPEFFPVNINRADKWQLMRVPGLGPETVRNIVASRKEGRINGIEQLGKFTKRLQKAFLYLRFD